MRIKLDENLPHRLVPLLTELGHRVDTVPDEGLAGENDAVVWQATPRTIAAVGVVHETAAEIEAISDRVRRSISLLREHRSALITAAVTGQIDVTNSVRTVFPSRATQLPRKNPARASKNA